MPRNRSNPLALAVLICLYERPMHPYEIATTLRQRNKQESVRLNYGSLYSVVGSLERRGLISPKETERDGRLPERTIYELTEPGRIEIHDWMTDLVSVPVKEYPEFEAALSFLPALAPDEVVDLLDERARRLELSLAQIDTGREVMEKQALPRLFWIEDEFVRVLREAELGYVRQLAGEIAAGTLEGTDWWRQVHDDPAHAILPPDAAPVGPGRPAARTRTERTATTSEGQR
jgi:DNA-binding PadR family transcriptional regulator